MNNKPQTLDWELGELFGYGWYWHKASAFPGNKVDFRESRDRHVRTAKQAILAWVDKEVIGENKPSYFEMTPNELRENQREILKNYGLEKK